MKCPIQIFLTCDARYIEPLRVIVLSLLKTANPCRELHLYIAHDQTFADQGCQERILQLCSRYPFASARFLNADELILGKYREVFKSELNDLAAIIWAGPLISDVLPPSVTGRVIYLDIDMLVCQPLDELADLDLNGCVAAATVESPLSESPHLLACEHGSSQVYYNNGTMSIDLDAYRRRRFSERIIDWYTRHKQTAVCLDQDAQNAILGDCILPLALKWNYNDGYLARIMRITPFTKSLRTHPVRTVLEAAVRPGIIHYQCRKPWEFSHRPERKRYHQCMRELGVFDERLNGRTIGEKIELGLYDLYHAALRIYAKALLGLFRSSN